MFLTWENKIHIFKASKRRAASAVRVVLIALWSRTWTGLKPRQLNLKPTKATTGPPGLLHATNQKPFLMIYIYNNYLLSISFQQLCNQAPNFCTILVWDRWVWTPDKKEQIQDLTHSL